MQNLIYLPQKRERGPNVRIRIRQRIVQIHRPSPATTGIATIATDKSPRGIFYPFVVKETGG